MTPGEFLSQVLADLPEYRTKTPNLGIKKFLIVGCCFRED
jgi:hypothetical protein